MVKCRICHITHLTLAPNVRCILLLIGPWGACISHRVWFDMFPCFWVLFNIFLCMFGFGYESFATISTVTAFFCCCTFYLRKVIFFIFHSNCYYLHLEKKNPANQNHFEALKLNDSKGNERKQIITCYFCI